MKILNVDINHATTNKFISELVILVVEVAHDRQVLNSDHVPLADELDAPLLYCDVCRAWIKHATPPLRAGLEPAPGLLPRTMLFVGQGNGSVLTN